MNPTPPDSIIAIVLNFEQSGHAHARVISKGTLPLQLCGSNIDAVIWMQPPSQELNRMVMMRLARTRGGWCRTAYTPEFNALAGPNLSPEARAAIDWFYSDQSAALKLPEARDYIKTNYGESAYKELRQLFERPA